MPRYEKCPQCNGGPVTQEAVTEEFQYGAGEGAVTLKTVVPMFECAACEFSFTDYEGEDARTGAIEARLAKIV